MCCLGLLEVAEVAAGAVPLVGVLRTEFCSDMDAIEVAVALIAC